MITVPYLKNKYIPRSFTLSFWIRLDANLSPLDADFLDIMNQFRVSEFSSGFGKPSLILDDDS